MIRRAKLDCLDQRISRAGPASLEQVIATFTKSVAEDSTYCNTAWMISSNSKMRCMIQSCW
ncbi:hypothetical protein C8R48DRAFT_736158 [Suillus tomentosus]|nr:hypothetical protein C8R48DRAFT_736158 [Suillus tomentosus]